MSLKIQVHGHIEEVATFDALASALALYASWIVNDNGYVNKVSDPRQGLTTARNALLEKNMEDLGFEVSFEYDPDGAEEALMEFARAHEVDVTVTRKWGANGDGYVTFVRGGGDAIRLSITGGETAVTARTMRMLKERGMASVEMIDRLLSVMDDAKTLPHFTLADDVVRAAVLPKRSPGLR